MIPEDIIQGNLYQNKYDKLCIVIATKQENNNEEYFCGVNLSDGVYNFDWQLYAFESYNVSGKGKHLIQENLFLKERIMELVQKNIDQQKVNDQRFCDLYDSTKAKIDSLKKDQEEGIFYIGNLKLFIQHLQDYIAAKHLESEGLILEKFIQEEPYHGRKESSESTNSQP